ncbi:MAG TPA: hypothetical protein VLH84_01095 [Patescibacteria group bacterium]|nr:hypothetical protein [Patescibacteria group bacterium]
MTDIHEFTAADRAAGEVTRVLLGTVAVITRDGPFDPNLPTSPDVYRRSIPVGTGRFELAYARLICARAASVVALNELVGASPNWCRLPPHYARLHVRDAGRVNEYLDGSHLTTLHQRYQLALVDDPGSPMHDLAIAVHRWGEVCNNEYSGQPEFVDIAQPGILDQEAALALGDRILGALVPHP